MGRELRLRGRRDFANVLRQGRVWANALVILRARPSGLHYNRYGFIIGKRLGKAVVRNRVRRRLREGVRTLAASGGWDIVISARAAAAQADYQELKRAVASLLARAGILATDQGEGDDDNP